MATTVVLDASAIVDVLTGAGSAPWIRERLRDKDIVVPGHALAEVLNALGRSARREVLTGSDVELVLHELTRMPLRVVELTELLPGAWARRDQHSLPDALDIELAARLDTVVLTTDPRLARSTGLAVAPPE
jgi:predicted nucleic acid-binding protein